jgi:glutathione peroxidase-family protein
MKLILLVFLLLIIGAGLMALKLKSSNGIPSGQIMLENDNTIYTFTLPDIDGTPISLSEYKGKVVLIVNVASKCGLTPQYEELEAYYKSMKDKGVVVLGFPANNFMSQEPGSDADIKAFCTLNYGVTFPMFSKISVKGKDKHPLYKYLTEKSQNGWFDEEVSWNFQKFLINREGKLIRSFSPKTSVKEKSFSEAVDALL